jgi:hypothetical protein
VGTDFAADMRKDQGGREREEGRAGGRAGGIFGKWKRARLP